MEGAPRVGDSDGKYAKNADPPSHGVHPGDYDPPRSRRLGTQPMRYPRPPRRGGKLSRTRARLRLLKRSQPWKAVQELRHSGGRELRYRQFRKSPTSRRSAPKDVAARSKAAAVSGEIKVTSFGRCEQLICEVGVAGGGLRCGDPRHPRIVERFSPANRQPPTETRIRFSTRDVVARPGRALNQSWRGSAADRCFRERNIETGGGVVDRGHHRGAAGSPLNASPPNHIWDKKTRRHYELPDALSGELRRALRGRGKSSARRPGGVNVPAAVHVQRFMPAIDTRSIARIASCRDSRLGEVVCGHPREAT